MTAPILFLLGGVPQAAAVDPYFYSVTSLLHGDGTNGAQNNTFLDSSTNNFTITRNGNTTQGSFSPFSQTGWSNYFDGSGDYLTGPSNSAFDFGSGSFTVEFWVYKSSSTNTMALIGTRTSDASSGIQWSVYVNGSGYLECDLFDTSNNRIAQFAHQTLFTLNAWNHCALVRNGTSIYLYYNGVQSTSSGSSSASVANSSTVVRIGNFSTFANFDGYMSNVRIVKGTAVYTASFTVPTTPLTAITNTSLLTCQANRFLDASTNAFAITANGNVSVQPFSPFNPTTAYSTSTVGGSGYFDGSGDYLNFAGATANAMGSGDFTIEGWFYLTGTTGQGGSGEQGIIGVNTVAASRLTIRLQGTSPKVMSWWLNGPGNNVAGTTAIQQNTWYHFALVRSGSASNNVKLYLNGVLESQGTSTYDVPTGDYVVGRTYTDLNGEYWNGFLSGIRAVKGTAVYTGNFTPPTAPPTAISNTSYLFNFTNAGIFDNAADADYETVGNAQISTSVKKYGTGSMSFDGTGDYLPTASNQNFAFRTGDFTVEYWIYTNSSADDGIFQLSTTAGGFATSYTNGMMMAVVSGVLYYALGGSSASTGFTINNSTWYHIAMCRTSGVVKVFVNGTQVASAANTTDVTATNLVIGGYYSTSYTLVGYIDDFRISSGVARYPYNFTPPTAEFPNIGGTVTLTADPYYDYTTLLLPGNGTNGAQNNTFLDSSANAFSITRNGNTTQGTFSPFSQTGWGAYFDGTGDYLSTNATQAIPATGDFTIEAWVYPTVSGAGRNVVSQGTSGSSGRLQLNVHTDNTLQFGITSTLVYSTGTVTPNAWNYIAVTRTGSSVSFYINNGPAGTATLSGTVQNTALWIGAEWSGDPYRWLGYISNVRISSVVRTITAAPTAAFTSDANTVVLTCQSNRFIDNSTNAYTITRNGDVSVQAFSPFNPTAAWSAATNGGSGYFDGSGDYLTVADNAAFDLPGDFTLELWGYITTTGTKYFCTLGDNTSANNGFLIYYFNTDQKLKVYANSANIIESSSTLVLNQWNHIALVRSGSTMTLYVNGVSQGTATNSTSWTGVAGNGFMIGAEYSGGATTANYAGYINGVRLVKGTAVYTGAFTPPTAPLTAITNTQLLCNFTNAGIYDATSKNDLETVGNAQISTTQSKFGGSSMAFDGTGDDLILPSTENVKLGTGDFTIEAWIYPNVVNIAYQYVFFGPSGPPSSLQVLLNNATFYLWNVLSHQTSVSATTWNHIAIVRSNGSISLYLNGVKSSSSYSYTGAVTVSNIGYASFNGYIQDVRFTKGIARYFNNFTPPTTAFLTL